jgi:leucine dehydrogenase
MRLARGMTLKSAAVGLPLGGGKAVGWLDSRGKSDELLRAFGRFLPRLEGRYITAEDVGTTVSDMDFMDVAVRRYTDRPLVVCRSIERGGGGNPSPYTARGVLEAMRIACERVLGTGDLSGRVVALQGLGNVGAALANMLLGEGASLMIADIDYDKLQHVLEDPRCEKRCDMLPRQELYAARCDLFSPCAMGGVLNDRTIPKMNCRIVAGSANNQLEEEGRDALLLSERGILYAPDFVINSGGIINAAMEYLACSRGGRYSPEAVEEKIAEIFSNLRSLFDRAQASGRDTHAVALEMARERLRQP